MSTFAAVTALLCLLVIVVMLRPRWGARAQDSSTGSDPTQPTSTQPTSTQPTSTQPSALVGSLKDQLRQLSDRHAAGALDADAYAKGRAALERKLLDAVMSDAEQAPASPPAAMARSAATGAARPSNALSAVVAGFVLAVVAGGYAWVGTPAALDPAARSAGAAPEGAAEQADALRQIDQLIAKLEQRLQGTPDDVEGWAMLGRAYAVTGRHAKSLPAFQKALTLNASDPVLLADAADAMAVTQDGKFDGEPMRMINRALELDPRNVKALALLGTEAFERKDYAAAVKAWETAAAHAPAGPMADRLGESLTEARQRAGAPPQQGGAAPTAPALSAGATGVAGAASAVAKGTGAAPARPARVSGTITLAPELAKDTSPQDTLFVFARPAEGTRMPLAILRKRVSDLPLRFELDDSMAMSPAATLSSVDRVVIGARISKSGDAMPKPGDLQGFSAAVAVGSTDSSIEIRERVATGP
jgi:cytochrome c-type biogenesis protein CcmH